MSGLQELAESRDATARNRGSDRVCAEMRYEEPELHRVQRVPASRASRSDVHTPAITSGSFGPESQKEVDVADQSKQFTCAFDSMFRISGGPGGQIRLIPAYSADSALRICRRRCASFNETKIMEIKID